MIRSFGKIIFHILSNAVALFAASYFVSGFIFTGEWIKLGIAAAIFTAINIIIKPIVKMFLGPFIILSLGLFTVLINALMLYILDIVSPELTIQGYGALISATIIISVANVIFGVIGRIIK